MNLISDKCHNIKKGWFSKNDYLFNVLNGSSWLLHIYIYVCVYICIFISTGALVIQYQNT